MNTKVKVNKNKSDQAVRKNQGQSRKDMDARELALSVLMDILEDGAFSHLALRRALNGQLTLSERDRAFVTRLVEGTVERVIQLDYILNGYSKLKVKKMKPLIRNILRLSSYQILFMDKVPDSAAVNEGVKLGKKKGLKELAPYLNAVLRSVEREKAKILADLAQEEKTPLSVRYSLPDWLFQYLRAAYGREEACRMGTYFLEGENLSFVRHKDGRSEQMDGNIAATEAFQTGEITVQDYASQQVGILANPKPGDFVVDVCAAPGGKSCHVAELLKGSGRVSARDVSQDKVSMIEENAGRLQLTNLEAKVWDARKRDDSLIAADGTGKADILLCDVPCSGLGIMKKKPDIRLSASLQGIRELQKLQREILDTVKDYVKPGGRLLYSTCTLTREENEQNRYYIEKELGFTLLSEKKLLPGQPSDGFYIAEFQKPLLQSE